MFSFFSSFRCSRYGEIKEATTQTPCLASFLATYAAILISPGYTEPVGIWEIN